MLECLKKAGRIAQQCMDTSVQVQLLVELLNTYILFYEKGNEQVARAVLHMYIQLLTSSFPKSVHSPFRDCTVYSAVYTTNTLYSAVYTTNTLYSAVYTGSASDQGSIASQCEGVGGRRVGRGDPAALPEHSGTHNSH